jgi:S-adenosylmethionine hydrolase
VPIITLTTDFGLKDGFTGTLKGVIWSICPKAQIADISNEITPQKILQAALIFWRAYRFFPKGTVHLVVVDPGVGTDRRPIAIKTGGNSFVGPDNGLFTPIFEDATRLNWKIEIYHLTNTKYFLPNISNTFHGRDIFAPVAAHLASGIPIIEFGHTITNPVRIALPKPHKTSTGWEAHVIAIDRFGNITTDLPVEFVKDRDCAIVKFDQYLVQGIVGAYGVASSGELLALADSEGRVELAVVSGNAGLLTGVKLGDIIEVVE